MIISSCRRILQHKYWNNYALLYPKSYGNVVKATSSNTEQETKQTTTKTMESINSWTKSSFPKIADKIGSVPLMEHSTTVKEVGKSKEHLLDIQKQLQATGEKKRSIMKKLNEVRSVLNNIYQGMEIEKINAAYLNSARKEMDVLCEMEKHLCKMYYEVDQEELLLLAESSLAINGAFEKAKKDRKFMKLVSIAGAVVSSLLTVIFISYNHSKQQKILESTISQLINEKDSKESWGSYFKRNSRWMYSWAKKSN